MATKTFPPARAVPEGSSRRYSATLVDFDGNPIQAGQITSILFSLLDARTNAVINNRDRVQVRNANGGTLSSLGVFSQVFSPSDTVTTDDTPVQPRRAIFQVTFLDGVENHEVIFWVQNLAHIPAT